MKEKKNIFRQVWDIWVSMKFATIMLIILGALSLLAMLMNEYPSFFERGTWAYNFLKQHDPYSSIWYNTILLMIISSVFFCVIQRTQTVLQSFRFRRFRDAERIRKMRYFAEISPNADIETTLKKAGYKFAKNGNQLTASKFRLGPFGSWLSHVGLLVIFIGGMIYSTTSKKSFHYLISDELQKTPIITDLEMDLSSLFSWEIPVTDKEKITVKVDSFRVRFYENSMMVSDYRSYVKIYDDEENLMKTHEITVNSPFIYKTVSIHQSDFKPLVEELFLNVPNRDARIQRISNTLKSKHVEDQWITGLSMKKYHGKTVIFAGMIIGCLGLLLSFYFWRRDLWIAPHNGQILIGGRSAKNMVAFEREFKRMLERMKQ